MISRDFRPLRSGLQSGFIATQLIITASKIRQYVQQRRLGLKWPAFRVLVERLLPVGNRGLDGASLIAGQTPVGPYSLSFMANCFGKSRVRFGGALKLNDRLLIPPFRTEIDGTTDSAFTRAFLNTSLRLQLPRPTPAGRGSGPQSRR